MPRGRHDQPGAEDGRGSPTAEEEKEDAAKLKTMEPSKLTEGMFQSLFGGFQVGNGWRRREGNNGTPQRRVWQNVGPVPPN